MRSAKMILAAITLGLAQFAWAGAAIDVNTAGAAELAKALKGVGMAKAQAIVDYRTQHGPFKTVEDLAQVKGIGFKLVNANRDALHVNAPAPAQAQPIVKTNTPK